MFLLIYIVFMCWCIQLISATSALVVCEYSPFDSKWSYFKWFIPIIPCIVIYVKKINELK